MNREIFLDGVAEIVCDYVCDSYRTEKIAKEITLLFKKLEEIHELNDIMAPVPEREDWIPVTKER